jgi:hypothetical protein
MGEVRILFLKIELVEAHLEEMEVWLDLSVYPLLLVPISEAVLEVLALLWEYLDLKLHHKEQPIKE